MSDTNTSNWDNYWQGRSSQRSGNALVEVGIENNHALNAFWTDIFRKRETSEAIIDFACGAGSVLNHAHEAGFSDLTGVDVSQEALNVMTVKIPPAVGICSEVDKIPKSEKCYDLVVSQFGVEYAGSRKNLLLAFEQMQRILHPGGDIIIVAHAKDSIIYNGCKSSLDMTQMIEDSAFLTTAQRIVSIMPDAQAPETHAGLQEELVALGQAAEPIMAWLRTSDRNRDEFARYIYYVLESSHTLISNHAAYATTESIEWFSGVQAELDAYKGRMSSMTKAALSKDETSDLIDTLETEKTGLKFQPVEAFHFAPNDDLAAWVIHARKQ